MYIIIFPLNIACLLGGDHKRTKSINLFCMQPTTVFACLRLLLLLLLSSVYTSDWLKCNLCVDMGVRRRRVRNLQCPTCDRDNTAQEPNSAVDGCGVAAAGEGVREKYPINTMMNIILYSAEICT